MVLVLVFADISMGVGCQSIQLSHCQEENLGVEMQNRHSECDNARCKSKGKRVTVRRGINALMAVVSSFDATPQVFAKRHPRFFVREIHKGSSWKYQKLKLLRQLLRQSQNQVPKTL
jgi:hypothetical protein